MDAQIQAVEHQYDADIQAIETAARNVINQVNDDLRNCLKRLDSQRNSMALNGVLIIGASLVACAVPVLLPTVGSFAVGAVQISAATTGLSAADNLFNGNGAVGVNFTVDVTYAHKPYVPPSYKSPALQKDIVLPNNHELGIELNPFSHNRISSQIYSNGNTVSQQKTNVSITNSENKKTTYKAPKVENKQKDNIEMPKTTPNQTGVINWSRMAWRSITQDKSPEVISWQQDNRNRFSGTASFFDGIANSKTQRVVDAFADEFAGRPVMFVKEELSLIKQGAQTKTAKFVENTAEALKDAKEFAVQDAARFITGDTTQTQIFFETVGKFIDADFERFRDGQATVIGTAIAADFKALANMTPEQLAAHLGHEAGDAFLFFFAGAGLQVGGRALTKTMDTAITLAKDFRATRTFQSPLLFQFKEGTLYSGFPFIGKSAEAEVIAKDIVLSYAQGNSISVTKALESLGFSAEQKSLLSKGQQVIVESSKNNNHIAAIYKIEGDRLTAGIYSAFTTDTSGALAKFSSDAKSLGRALGVKEVEFFGANIINERLESILVKRGFQPGPEISFEYYSNSVTADTLRKVINLNNNPKLKL
jgi:hypothetical protein